MSISVKCSACGHGYQAADHMAGRRVRCKHCGNTFQLPAEAVDASTPFRRPDETGMAVPPGVALRADPLAPPSRANAAAAAALAAAAAKKPAGPVAPPLAPPVAPPVASAVRVAPVPESDPEADAFLQNASDDVFDEAFNEYSTARGNTPFVFPGSHFLDQWLPWFLVVILVAWLAYAALSAEANEPGWVGVVRLLVLLMTYASVVFPASLKGVRMAARKMNYELPSGAPWRAFATFLLPVTLGCVVWLSSGSPAGLIFGTVLGTFVALPVMWLLFRIRPDDAPVSLGYGAAGFGAGVVAAVVLLAVLNLILVGVVRGAKSRHTLTQSPFGPGFMWDGATIEEAPKPPAPPKGPESDPAKGETLVSDDPDADRPDEAVEPDQSATTGPPGVQPTPEEVAKTEDQQVTPEQNFTTEMTEEDAVGGGRPAHGEIVAEVQQRFAGEMRQIIFPIIPGAAVAVIKDSERANEDDVELWDATSWRATAGAGFVRATGAPAEYTLSSDGSYLARIATWPQLSAQVYSFANDQLLRPIIKLDRAGLNARIAGFSANDGIVLLYKKEEVTRLEVWNVNKAKRLQRIEVGAFQPEPGNFALSRNGNLFAMIVQEPRQPGRLDVYDLAAGKLTRRIPVEALSQDAPVWSRGLTFSEKGDRVAALFERQGEGLFVCWGPGELPMHEHILPVGFVPDGVDPSTFGGDALGLLDQGRAWILYGSRVYDTASGRQLGDLGIPNIDAQKVTGPGSLLLLQRLDGTRKALLDVRLDLARVRKGAAAGR